MFCVFRQFKSMKWTWWRGKDFSNCSKSNLLRNRTNSLWKFVNSCRKMGKLLTSIFRKKKKIFQWRETRRGDSGRAETSCGNEAVGRNWKKIKRFGVWKRHEHTERNSETFAKRGISKFFADKYLWCAGKNWWIEERFWNLVDPMQTHEFDRICDRTRQATSRSRRGRLGAEEVVRILMWEILRRRNFSRCC